MAKVSLKKFGYLDSAKKVHTLITYLKTMKVILTTELKARIVGKIQGKDALNCWRERSKELEVPKPEEPKEVINVIQYPTQTITSGYKGKRKRRNKKGLVNNGINVDPNSANYDAELMKAELRNKFKDYNYDLSDW